MKGTIYCRISCKNDNGQSLDIQEQLCRTYCKDNNISIDKVCREIGSARIYKNMPLLKKIINSISSNEILLIADMTRFMRNLNDATSALDKLLKKEVTVISVGDNLVYNILSNKDVKYNVRHLLNQAEFESDLISERIRRSIAYRKKRGGSFGRVPFGSTTISDRGIKKHKPYDKEQKIIRIIENMIDSGTNTADIATHLNKKKLLYRTKKWNNKNVRYVYNRDNVKVNMKSLRESLDEIQSQSDDSDMVEKEVQKQTKKKPLKKNTAVTSRSQVQSQVQSQIQSKPAKKGKKIINKIETDSEDDF